MFNTPCFRAGYFPKLFKSQVNWREIAASNGKILEIPDFNEVQLQEICGIVQQHSQLTLKKLSSPTIIALIDRVANALLDPTHAYRIALDEWLGWYHPYDRDRLRLSLNQYLKNFRQVGLERFVAEDFVNPELLNGFQPSVTGGRCHALGLNPLIHIWAGNTPALGLWSWISGLLVKAGNVGKLSQHEPIVLTLFTHLLIEFEPTLENSLALVWWSSERDHKAIFSNARGVIAYGNDSTLADFAKSIPITTRYLPHGHKISIALISASCLTHWHIDQLLNDLVTDIVCYEQNGCYSPQLVLLQASTQVSVDYFCQKLRHQLNNAAAKHPPPILSIHDSLAIRKWRNSQALAGASQMWESPHSSVVLWDKLPINISGPNHRNIQIVSVKNWDDIFSAIHKFAPQLQSAGVACTTEELHRWSPLLAECGVTRICSLGQMTAPAAGWHHDGRFSLLDLVQFIDCEASAYTYSEDFNPYHD
ncbi:MAG: acyl-CoA reductase [Gammaproteobacteria bacterium]|nr:acyl-CoA reductase [Gammaproteobacteria bacterium]